MADVEARREARRRKILENSDKRLKKITSVDSNDDTPTVKKTQTTPSLNNVAPKKKVSLKVAETIGKPGVEHKRTDDLRTIYENPLPDDEVSTSEAEFFNFNQRAAMIRIWIVIILALVVRYLYLVSSQYAHIIQIDLLVWHNPNKIFLPFVLYQIAEYVFFRPSIPQSGFLNILFMLNVGIQSANIQKLITMCRITLQILRNLMVYFFTFVCFDQIIVFILQE